MSNSAVLTIAWLGATLYAVVALVTLWRMSALPLVHWMNCATALAVLAYWIPRWYSYAFQGIMWYGSDQLVPFYAIVVLVVSIAGLVGAFKSMVFPWLFFGINGLGVLAAALFFTFFRMVRSF